MRNVLPPPRSAFHFYSRLVCLYDAVHDRKTKLFLRRTSPGREL